MFRFIGRKNSLISTVGPQVKSRYEAREFSGASLLCKSSKRVLSKAGRLAWFAHMNGQPVKIYECHNEAQAIFIEMVSNNEPLKRYFPACLIRDGIYLVVEWIDGKSITLKQLRRSKKILSQIANIQAALHSNAVSSLESAGFSYIDYLKKRLERFKGIFVLEEVIEKIYTIIDYNAPLVKERVSHPDLTASNLIVQDGTGKLKVIDNELLTQNPYYSVDLLNTHHSFGRKNRNKIIERYLRCYVDHGGDLSILIEHEHFFNALWHLRLIGTYLQSGSIGRAFQLAQDYERGDYDAHPVVELGKEILA
jgi:serine/threonine protein kinase